MAEQLEEDGEGKKQPLFEEHRIRPLSKTVRFTVLKFIPAASSSAGKKAEL